jgi:hypothetical protein
VAVGVARPPPATLARPRHDRSIDPSDSRRDGRRVGSSIFLSPRPQQVFSRNRFHSIDDRQHSKHETRNTR